MYLAKPGTKVIAVGTISVCTHSRSNGDPVVYFEGWLMDGGDNSKDWIDLFDIVDPYILDNPDIVIHRPLPEACVRCDSESS